MDDTMAIKGISQALENTVSWCVPAILPSMDTEIMNSLYKLGTAYLVNLHKHVALFSMGFVFIWKWEPWVKN